MSSKIITLSQGAIGVVALLLLCGTTVHAQDTIGPWNKAELFAAPKYYPSDQFNVPGVKSILYEGLNYKGKPSRFYAYYGVPDGQAPATGWPGVVLVHGGGGTASANWVKQWNGTSMGMRRSAWTWKGICLKRAAPVMNGPAHTGAATLKRNPSIRDSRLMNTGSITPLLEWCAPIHYCAHSRRSTKTASGLKGFHGVEY